MHVFLKTTVLATLLGTVAATDHHCRDANCKAVWDAVIAADLPACAAGADHNSNPPDTCVGNKRRACNAVGDFDDYEDLDEYTWALHAANSRCDPLMQQYITECCADTTCEDVYQDFFDCMHEHNCEWRSDQSVAEGAKMFG
eukprot:SAG11_NODE_2897_length_2853_cov_2.156500_3_plen_142_part_00